MNAELHPDPGSTSSPTPFHAKIKRMLDAAESSVPPLTVLVWGPAENPTDPWWVKRVEIRDHLRTCGHDAYFSEELPGGESRLGDAHRLALRTAEMAHALAADYIIVLMSSFGSVSEFHDFGVKPNLARKMLLFFDQDHSDGYAASLFPMFRAECGRIEPVKVPDDLVACNVRSLSLSAVTDLRQLKVFAALEGVGDV